jgi:hypothetical protein
MTPAKSIGATVWLALGALGIATAPVSDARAQASPVDPAAVQVLKRMTDYLGALGEFSVRTQNTLEDLLPSGHRIDLDVSSKVTVKRPNRLRAERQGDLVDQVFYFDGKTLTLHNPSDRVYATESVPGTIEDALRFAAVSLGLSVPASDLVYPNAFDLLMQDVKLAVILGKTMIGGTKCTHLLFSRPGVDFQVWVAEGERPLPCKVVVTDRTLDGRLSVTTVMTDWNVAPQTPDARFTFAPPKGAKRIEFLRYDRR